MSPSPPLCTILVYACAVLLSSVQADVVKRPPNFIVLFTDDQGYEDLGCFGSPLIRTPNIDQMAQEGMRFTDFYAQTVCGPSRAALMTGCYPLRVAKKDNNQNEIHPFLHTKEITIAEVLKKQGYAAGCFGKWDLAGHRQHGYDESLLPTRQGFDYFFGTPTSNDERVNLLRNDELIENQADMAQLTKRQTDEAIGFMRKNKQTPFFVYVPYVMPHLRLAASESFKGKSPRGLYGDVIEELDFNVGRILKELKLLKLEKNTYVIFCSDNGPWFLDKSPQLSKQRDKGGSHGGDATPLRGHKTSTWEGGVRVPCVMWAPGRIPSGRVCSEIASTMDLLPTLAALAGGEVPKDRVIDGRDVSALMHGEEGAKSPTNQFFYYAHTQLMALRMGRWKLHLPHEVGTMKKRWDHYHRDSDLIDMSRAHLYDLSQDLGEKVNVAAEHPDEVKLLTELAESVRADIGDYNRKGNGARFYDPQPQRPDISKWLKK